MPPLRRQLHLNVFLYGVGNHEGAWRRPDSPAEHVLDLGYLSEVARLAEAGKLDSLFLADTLCFQTNAPYDVPVGIAEPLAVVGALCAVTERIGLVATASTTFSQPYDLVRRFATLDQLSGGRIGWNIVTSQNPAEPPNFGATTQIDHAERYARADEFVAVAKALWDSWEPGALAADRDAGLYVDPEKVRPVDFEGRWFSVRGPANVPRPPQGYPVFFQAGSSGDGRRFAARHAEAIFTAQQSIEDARAFYADVTALAAAHGRADQVKVLPGLATIVASTDAEVRALRRELNELTVPALSVRQLSTLLGTDLSGFPLDGPVPLDALEEAETHQGNRSRFELLVGLARDQRLTLRQLAARYAEGRGHRFFAGTPEQVADEIELWFTTGACDGFNLMPSHFPDGLRDLVEQVIPLLQRRGLFREEYAGTTLRDHLGLRHPHARAFQSPATTG